jgi:hypothetical protein
MEESMKTASPNTIGVPLHSALLLALSVSGALLVSGCNKPVEEPPVPTEATPPQPTEMPPAPTDQNQQVPPPADDPATTPAPTDSDAPPSGG